MPAAESKTDSALAEDFRGLQVAPLSGTHTQCGGCNKTQHFVLAVETPACTSTLRQAWM